MEPTAPKPNFDRQILEKTLRDVLEPLLNKNGSSDPRTIFYTKFKEEVDEHDEDLQKMHGGDLDSTLIFAGLFSAITSAFIIDIQSELKPDYEEMNNTLLELLLNATVGNIPPGQSVTPPRWTGPNPAIRQAQATLYATLCATLFAAFLATLGKQWLNQYSRTGTRGSIEERCWDRERKLKGIDRWRFHIIMQSASLIIQGSLGLLSSALSRYLWEVDRTVSSVVIGLTTFGFILYIANVAVSVRFLDCPFQTPVSSFLRWAPSGFKRFALGVFNYPFRTLGTSVLQWALSRSGRSPVDGPGIAVLAGGAPGALLPIHAHQVGSSLLPHLQERDKHDARCITRMFVVSSNVNTIRHTMAFVTEVDWDSKIKAVPLELIYKKLISCFDFTYSNTPVLIPTLREVAYLSAKAFTHIRVQQRCMLEREGSGQADKDPFNDIKYVPLHFPESSGDHDLESVLLMVENEFGRNTTIPWDSYRLSPAHHLWVSHHLVHDTSLDPLSGSASEFVEYSLDNSPSGPVVVGCLCLISTILGNPCAFEQIRAYDQRRQMDIVLDVIFRGLSDHFQGSSRPGAYGPERALRTLKLVTRLRTAAVATKSYELFETIMSQAEQKKNMSQAEQEKNMEAARLALDAAYRPELTPAPPVGDPQHILDFLHYHLDLRIEREDCIRVVFPAMRAIDSVSNDPTSQPWNWHIQDAGELLTRFRREIERVKELEGATAVVTLEEAYGRLTAFIDDRNKPHPPALPNT